MPHDKPAAPSTVRVAVTGAVVPDVFHLALPHTASDVDMAQFVAFRAAACVGADYSNLALLDRTDGRTLRLYHGTFLEPSLIDRFIDVDVEDDFPIATAVRTGEIISLGSPEAYRNRFPEIWAETAAAGIQATVSLPLSRADGSMIGAIGFAWTTAPSFDVSLDKALKALAHLCTEIFERAEVTEAEHQLIVELHQRLLGSIPEVAGIETAARYLPAGVSTAVGGDWYEGLTLDDGTFGLVVGDVNGHGLAAAADMALIRGLITALLHDGATVPEVFARVSRVLDRRAEDVLATAALAVIDVQHSTITYATAGHPPPLLIGPDGAVVLLDAANCPMLGVPNSQHRAATAPFPVGAQLVMYTDGLVERSDRPFDDGILEAVGLIASLESRLRPTELIDQLLDALIGDQDPADDIAIVIIEHITTS